jgi:tape measure domain-containing protein
MSVIAEMAVKVTADTRELMSKIQNDGEKAGNGFGSKFAKGFGVIGGAALAAGAVGATAAAGMAAFGVKVAAANQAAAVSFETLLGSGEKASAFLKDLGAFAAKTPFELPELRDAAARLVATGVEANRVIPIMEALGDSTAAMGTGAQGIDRAVTALQQMSNSGRVTAGDMNQLASAGIPAWNALAASIGKSPAAVRELVANGEVEVETLLTAIENKTGSTFGRVAGTMEKQSATLVGQFSTLKDTVSQTLGQVAQPLADSLQKALPDVTKAVDGLVKGFEPAITSIGGLIQSLTPTLVPLGQAIGKIGNALVGGLSKGFNALAPVIQKLAPVLGAVGEALGDVIGRAFTALAPILPRIAQSIADLLTALMPLVPVLGDILIAFAPLIELFGKGLEVIVPIIAGIVQFIAQSTILRTTIIVITAAWIGLNIAMSMNPIGLIVIAIVALVGVLKLLWDAVGGSDFFIGVWENIKTAVSAVADWFMNTLVPLFGKVWDLLLAGLNLYLTPYKLAWNAIQMGAKVVADWFMSTLVPFFQKVWGLLGKAVELYVLPYKIAWNAIQAVAQTVVSWFQGTLLPFFTNLFTRLGKGWTVIKDKAVEVWNGIVDFMKGIVTQFTDIGRQIVEGLKNGILNAWGSFTSLIMDKAKGFIDGVKGVFGIRSPSRVMIEIGGNIVEGFRIGVEPIGKVSEESMRAMERALTASEKRINDWVEAQKKTLDDAIQAWKDYRSQSMSAMLGGINVGDAQTKADESVKAAEDAYKRLNEARTAAQGPNASAYDQQNLADAQTAYDQAKAGIVSFEQAFQQQLDQSNMFGTALQKMQEAITAQFGADSPGGQMLMQQLMGMGPVAGTNLANSMLGPIGSDQNGLLGTVVSGLTSANVFAGKTATSMANNAKGSGVAQAIAMLGGLGKKVKDEEAKLIALGEEIGAGMILGFKNKQGAFKKVVEDYIKTAKETLEIKSPSRVFMEIGDFAAQGYNKGFDGAIMDPSSLVPDPVSAQAIAGQLYAPAMTAELAAPQVRVYIGETELTDIVRTEVGASNDDLARSLTLGRR